MALRKVIIYTLADPRTGEVRYVGKTENLKSRFYSHLRDHGLNYKCRWVKSLLKCGILPNIEVLEEIESSDDSDWQECESFWISYLRFLGVRLANSKSGGEIGCKFSPEIRLKMSIARRRRVITPETRKKLSIAHFGKKKSPIHCAHIGDGHRGKVASEASREKMRQRMLGATIHPNTKAALIASNIGRQCSAETKIKIGTANRGRLRSIESRRKQRETWIAKRNALNLQGTN